MMIKLLILDDCQTISISTWYVYVKLSKWPNARNYLFDVFPWFVYKFGIIQPLSK